MIEYLHAILLFLIGGIGLFFWWRTKDILSIVLGIALIAGGTAVTTLVALVILPPVTVADMLSYTFVVLPVLVALIGILFFLRALRGSNAGIQLIYGVIVLAIAITLISYGIADPAIHAVDTINSGWWMIIIGISVLIEATFAWIVVKLTKAKDQLTYTIFTAVLILLGFGAILLGVAMIYLDLPLIPG